MLTQHGSQGLKGRANSLARPDGASVFLGRSYLGLRRCAAAAATVLHPRLPQRAPFGAFCFLHSAFCIRGIAPDLVAAGGCVS